MKNGVDPDIVKLIIQRQPEYVEWKSNCMRDLYGKFKDGIQLEEWDWSYYDSPTSGITSMQLVATQLDKKTGRKIHVLSFKSEFKWRIEIEKI